MFFIKTIKLAKKYSNDNRIILLFDETTSNPCLYPLLYSLSFLRFQSFSTQQSDLLALQFWYEFWFKKNKTHFCKTFFQSGYNPDTYLNEIDNFTLFLENDKQYQKNIFHLRSNENVNYSTVAYRIRSVFKFFKFLLDEYWNVRYQELTIKDITIRRKQIDLLLTNKKKTLSKFSRNGSKNGNSFHFKSLDNEMVYKLYDLIRPNQSNKINKNNPFSTQQLQLRNFLIVHLMINYGLRVGELMLLTKKSIKKSMHSDTYNLIVTNTDDEYETRSRRPSIKNEGSHRVIKLNSLDFQFINVYIENIRMTSKTEILFTSLKPPYSPLSYSAINTIFNKIDIRFRQLHPMYFDKNLIGSISKVTPHVCRHTWAYITLAYAVKNYRDKNRYKILMSNEEIMQNAQEDLRALGGWSVNSLMPSYYAKRYIMNSANLLNLHRISAEKLGMLTCQDIMIYQKNEKD